MSEELYLLLRTHLMLGGYPNLGALKAAVWKQLQAMDAKAAEMATPPKPSYDPANDPSKYPQQAVSPKAVPNVS